MAETTERLNSALRERYRIERPLGSGGSATVYLAWDIRHQRNVAVKVLAKAAAHGLDVDRFMREIEIVAGLTHPHILPLHDSGAVDGVPFFVMPYLEEGTLRDRLDEGPLSPTEATRITAQIADALRAAHESDILHRDVKPENIMLTQGHALLVDFGIAGSRHPDAERDEGGTSGTPIYMAPEQSFGDTEANETADLYSLGCVFFEMLTGRPPFTSKTHVGLVTAHLTERPPTLADHGVRIAPEVQEIVDALLAKQPEARPQSAAALLKLLRRAALGRGSRRDSGRPEEEARILEAIEDVREGRFRAVLVEGDPGVGKSTLLDAVRSRVAAAGIRVLHGAASRASQSAYEAWESILTSALGFDGPADPGAMRAAVVDALGADDETLPVLNDVLSLGLPETRVTDGMDGDSRAQAARDLVTRILRRAAGGGTLAVFLDDIQWLDGASWSLVMHSLPSAGTVVGVFASRPGRDFVPAEALELLESEDTVSVTLGGMDVDGIRFVAEDAIGGGPVGDALATWLRDRSDGNPYYAREIALGLVEAGDLEVFGGEVVRSPSEVELGALPLPAAVEDWILARVDRLPDAHRDLLETASVLGRGFRQEELKVLWPDGGAKARIHGILEELVAAQLFMPRGEGYAFAHQITRDEVYRTLAEERRTELHRRFAEWLEDQDGSDRSTRYPRLAYHWRRAGSVTKTMRYLELAAEETLRQGAFGDAAEHLNRLLEIDRRQGGASSSRSHWHCMLGAAYFGDGKSFEAAEHAATALDQYGVKVPRSTLGWAVRAFREIVVQALHLIRTPRKFERGTPEHDRLSDIVRAASIQSDFRYATNETVPYFALIVLATNLADRMEADEGVAHAISPIAAMAGMIGLSKLAKRYLDYTRRIATVADDPRSLARVRVVEAALLCWNGRLLESLDAILAGEEIARTHGLRHELGELSGIAANTLMALGEHERHRVRGEAFLEGTPGRGPTVTEIWGHLMLAQYHVRVGRFEEADRHLARLRSFGARVPHQERAAYEAVEVLLNARRREWSQLRISTQRLSESLGVGAGTTLIFSHWQSFLALAEGRLALVERATDRDRSDEIAEAARAAKAHAKFAKSFRIALPHALLFRGRLSALEGRADEAAELLDSARDAALEHGDRYGAAKALHYRALAEPHGSDRRDEWLRTAEAEYETLGCQWDVGSLRRVFTDDDMGDDWP